MEIKRIRSKIEMDLTETDAQGLICVLSNNPQLVTQEQFQKGQMIWSWFYQQVSELSQGKK